MMPRDEVHVVFGTGPVGLAVMRELHGQGKRVRLVNRSGAAAAPQGVEVVKGNAAAPAFTRPGVPGCDRRLQLCQRALYRTGLRFCLPCTPPFSRARRRPMRSWWWPRISICTARSPVPSPKRFPSTPPHVRGGAREDGRGADGGPSRGHLTTRQMLTLFFEEAHLPPRMSSVPDLLVRMLGLFNPLLREVAEMLYEFNEPFVVDSNKFVQAFGDIATPHYEAVRHTLEWYRLPAQTKAA